MQTAHNVAPAKAARRLRAKYPLPLTRQSILGSNFAKNLLRVLSEEEVRKSLGKQMREQVTVVQNIVVQISSQKCLSSEDRIILYHYFFAA